MKISTNCFYQIKLVHLILNVIKYIYTIDKKKDKEFINNKEPKTINDINYENDINYVGGHGIFERGMECKNCKNVNQLILYLMLL